MKTLVVVFALVAYTAAAPTPNGGVTPYAQQAVPVKAATYTSPGTSYQAKPISYAPPMFTFYPPKIHYNGHSVTCKNYQPNLHSSSAPEGYNSGGVGENHKNGVLIAHPPKAHAKKK